MQAVALRPPRGQVTGMLAGIGLLVAGMAVMPALCLPFGFLLPLFACPLMGGKKQWAAIAAAAAPPAVALFYGAPALLALSLLFTCGAPVLTAALLPAKKSASPLAFWYYLGAYGFAVILVLIGLSAAAGGELATGIAQWVTRTVGSSENAGANLYRLAASGLISLPAGYESRGMASFLIDPVLSRQMLMSLRLTVEETVRQLLPTMIVQTCMLGGVFTALRVQRLNHAFLLVDEQHKERVKLAVMPGFSMLQMSPMLRRTLTAMGLVSLCCLLANGSWSLQLGLLLYAAFDGGFQLLGAAVLTGLLSRKKPEAKMAFGALTAAIYVLFPTVLFLLGIMDSLMHFRETPPLKKEDHEL